MGARFAHLKVGDTVIRKLGGVVSMPITVFEVTNGIIKCRVQEIGDDYWQFDVVTGAEIDPDLNWGPPPMLTGSFLVANAKWSEQDHTWEYELQGESCGG